MPYALQPGMPQNIDFLRDIKDRVTQDEINLKRILQKDTRLAGHVRFDTFNQCERMWGERVTDYHLNMLQVWVQEVYCLNFTIDKVSRMVGLVAVEDAYSPIQEYLTGLQWDGVRRIDTWLTTHMGVEETELTRAYGRKWLLSAVWRALRPGTQVDTVLVFQGEQGAGKSTGLRNLAGTEWFGDSPLDVGNPQKVGQTLAGKWIYELAELSSFSRRTQDEVKHFVTEKVDDYRPPYGKRNITVPRTVVFCGTTNNPEFLMDHSGSRRFWVVRAGTVRTAALMADRDQLWAEAYVEIMTQWTHPALPGDLDDPEFQKAVDNLPECVRWWLTSDQEKMREDLSEQFEVERPIITKLEDLLRTMGRQGEGFTHKWLTENLRLGYRSREDRNLLLDVSRHLDKLGYRKVRTSSGYYWRHPAESNQD